MIPDEYFDIGAPMFVGKRFVHLDCTPEHERGALIVTRVPEGWKWHCYRCEKWGKRSTSTLSPEAYKRWQETKDVQVETYTKNIELPSDYSNVIPDKGLSWLYKYGIDALDMGTYSIGYSKMLDRVILPVYSIEGDLVYWQGRNLGTIDKTFNPKYLNVWSAERKDTYFRTDLLETEQVVLVEDILSAIRVGNQYDAIGLLYAYAPDNLILELVNTYKEVIVWLDQDKRDVMLKRVVRYRAFGMNVRMINSDLDPKSYTDDEIEEFIEGDNV